MIRRAKVMEDLKDEMLAQVGTPKKASAETHWKEETGGRDRQHQAAPRAAADDSAIPRKSNTEEEDVVTRRMFDKRELRRRNKEDFCHTLAMWRAQHLQDSHNHASDASPSRVRVCVRKRPLFDNEVQADEFDVISVRDTEVVVHNCLTKADLKQLFVSHMNFPFSRVFGEQVTDDEVYRQCAAPAVEHVLQAGVATIFMFGQTGSGKTHTMRGLLNRTIAHIFHFRVRDEPQVGLTAFEIAGKSIRDLLDVSGSPKEVKVMRTKAIELMSWVWIR
jgi:kinesin family protein 2/24